MLEKGFYSYELQSRALLEIQIRKLKEIENNRGTIAL